LIPTQSTTLFACLPMPNNSRHDEDIRDDITQHNKSADKCYLIRLLIVFASFLT